LFDRFEELMIGIELSTVVGIVIVVVVAVVAVVAAVTVAAVVTVGDIFGGRKFLEGFGSSDSH
jgi:hypothetical protein